MLIHRNFDRVFIAPPKRNQGRSTNNKKKDKMYTDNEVAENMVLDEHEEYLNYISKYKHEWEDYRGVNVLSLPAYQVSSTDSSSTTSWCGPSSATVFDKSSCCSLILLLLCECVVAYVVFPGGGCCCLSRCLLLSSHRV